jgi:hypothetical protein
VKRPLSVRDVGELLHRSARARNAILVGGQALNVWAVHYGLAAETAAVSQDIDFFGSRADAIAAGLDWDAEVLTATLDDHTPNSAVVLIEIDNEERGIDFLGNIAGVDSAELRRWAATVRGEGFEFCVMHPLHVLQSQFENIYGILRRRDEPGGDYYVDRLRLAVKVVGSSICTLLHDARTREALNAVERVAEIAVKRPALTAWQRDGLDALNAIPDHMSWPAEFIDRRREQIEKRVARKRRNPPTTNKPPEV